jgi:hypothetical protein
VPGVDDADLAVVRSLTDDVRDYLQTGGKVLWLATSADSLQTYIGGLRIVDREDRVWEGDWVSNFNWINQETLFREVPTDGLVNFAFADLTPDHVIHGLRAMDFATSVHAGLFVGWVHRSVALIAEQPVGKGRLLICTFRLRRNLRTQPVAAIMLRDLIAYLGRIPATETVPAGPPALGA